MPPRRDAVQVLMQHRYGPQVFDGLTGTCRTMPDYDERRAELDAAWALLVDVVDWQRVLLMAAGHHVELRMADPAHGAASLLDDSDVCGDCLAFALLTWER